MPQHPHPSLRTLLQHVRNDAEIWLPSIIKSGRQGWMWRGVQHIEAVSVWLHMLVALCLVMSFVQAWWLLMAALIATALVARHWGWKDPAQDHDLPLEWNGWCMDVQQRTLVRIGVLVDEAAQRIDTLCLDPADAWSLGVLMGDTRESKAIYAWSIELRHRSRGPVAVLCSVHSVSAARVVMQDVDALVDALAQRLGIRRTGSRLVPLKR